MGATKASTQEIESFLAEMANWRLEDGKLYREYRFRDFVQAFGFMAQAALLAEGANHHPEWFNVYNRVVVNLTTHDAGGISEKDFDLARRMEEIATAD
jgi:4a-hydroxytetrahydrobiopterin dehydratase